MSWIRLPVSKHWDEVVSESDQFKMCSQKKLVRESEKQDSEEEEEKQRCYFMWRSSLGPILEMFWSVSLTTEFLLAWSEEAKIFIFLHQSVTDCERTFYLSGICSKWFHLSKFTFWEVLKIWAIRKGASRSWEWTCVISKRNLKGIWLEY